MMMLNRKKYAYVGPEAIRASASPGSIGTRIESQYELKEWVRRNEQDREYGVLTATFTLGIDLSFRLAPRRSEHVACSGGGPVLSAGEISFDLSLSVVAISNQSTGFCPEPESWPLVGIVLDKLSVGHPGGFTTEIVFRLCVECGQRNIVKDEWFVCDLCNAELTANWNFDDLN